MAEKLGAQLVRKGLIQDWQLEDALKVQQEYGCRLGTNLVELEFLDVDTLAENLAEQRKYPVAKSADFESAPNELLPLIPEKLADKHLAFPLAQEGRKLKVAFAVPYEPVGLDAIQFATGLRIVPYIAPELRIFFYLDRRYGIVRPARYIRRPEKRSSPTPTASPPPASSITGGNALFGSLKSGEFLSVDADLDGGNVAPTLTPPTVNTAASGGGEKNAADASMDFPRPNAIAGASVPPAPWMDSEWPAPNEGGTKLANSPASDQTTRASMTVATAASGNHAPISNPVASSVPMAPRASTPRTPAPGNHVPVPNTIASAVPMAPRVNTPPRAPVQGNHLPVPNPATTPISTAPRAMPASGNQAPVSNPTASSVPMATPAPENCPSVPNSIAPNLPVAPRSSTPATLAPAVKGGPSDQVPLSATVAEPRQTSTETPSFNSDAEEQTFDELSILEIDGDNSSVVEPEMTASRSFEPIPIPEVPMGGEALALTPAWEFVRWHHQGTGSAPAPDRPTIPLPEVPLSNELPLASTLESVKWQPSAPGLQTVASFWEMCAACRAEDQIAMATLDYCSKRFSRGAYFVSRFGVATLWQGFNLADGGTRADTLRINLNSPSIIRAAHDGGVAVASPNPQTPMDQWIWEALMPENGLVVVKLAFNGNIDYLCVEIGARSMIDVQREVMEVQQIAVEAQVRLTKNSSHGA